MKKFRRYIGIAAVAALLATPFAANAQSLVSIDFESTDNPGYSAIGVYDSWENSPFRNGKLDGNIKIVNNHLNTSDSEEEEPANGSSKIVGFQRSRFASNVFGARFDLAEPIELGPTLKYVHVNIYRPVEGRVMLVGLGRRKERTGQSTETEQFTNFALNSIPTGKWSDAVFSINSQEGVMLYSLVVVPQCERTDTMTSDYAVYFDNIEINDSPTPRIVYGDYPIYYDATATLSRSDRYTNTVGLTSPTDSVQSITVDQQTTKLLYTPLLSKTFYAKAGETVTPSIGFNTNWMHGYVYVDYSNDGQFNYDLNEDGTPTTGGELVSYTYYSGKNSKGASASSNPGMTLPSFTIPADTKAGIYRMRFKVDWDNIDPAGNSLSGQQITSNGGAIIDVRLCVHGDEVTLSRGTGSNGKDGLNGDIAKIDGTAISTETVLFNTPYTVVCVPESGFETDYLRVIHGYNLDGDSLVHGTPQYLEECYPAYLLKESITTYQNRLSDGQLTLPASIIDGNVKIIPVFSEKKGETTKGDYPRNFSDDLLVTRSDRSFTSFTAAATHGGTTTVTIPSGTNYVYRPLLTDTVVVCPGDEVQFSFSYVDGKWMHSYVYADWDDDGYFNYGINANGVPALGSEVLAYSYYQGYNSNGLSVPSGTSGSSVQLNDYLPAFTVSELMPDGDYRGRVKIDWDEIDPAGHWSEGGTNLIDENGGYIVDFIFRVDSNILTGISAPVKMNDLTVTTAPSTIRMIASTPTNVVISDLSGRTVFAGQVSGSKSVTVQRGIYIVAGHKILVP